MGDAKKIIVKTIKKPVADKIIKKYHYSGKVVQNSSLNFGVFYKGLLLGAMQYGSPTDKRKMLSLVKDAKWNDMMELNRMAFSDALPRFSESRAIAMSIKWIRKNAPHIKWIISFADGTQCGHGTIYQATNFKLIQIKKNTRIIELPNGERTHFINFSPSQKNKYTKAMKAKGYTNEIDYLNNEFPGWKKLDGYMFKYIYFLCKEAEANFTGEIIPFERINEMKIGMYKGEKMNGADR